MKKIICTIFVLFFALNSFSQNCDICDIQQNITQPPQPPQPKYSEKEIRTKLLDSINKQLYVREAGGPNRGKEVDNYLKMVNCAVGNPWCAAFVSANLTWQGVKNPKSAWSPDYALKQDIIWKEKIKIKEDPKGGDVITYYYSNIGRVGHVGFFEKIDKNGYFITIEGNTNDVGSREGTIVSRKKRSKKKIKGYLRY